MSARKSTHRLISMSQNSAEQTKSAKSDRLRGFFDCISLPDPRHLCRSTCDRGIFGFCSCVCRRRCLGSHFRCGCCLCSCICCGCSFRSRIRCGCRLCSCIGCGCRLCSRICCGCSLCSRFRCGCCLCSRIGCGCCFCGCFCFGCCLC